MLATILGALVVVWTAQRFRNTPAERQTQAILAGVYALGFILWPVLWMHLTRKRKHSEVGLVWPMIILLLELHLLKYNKVESKNKSMLSMDANAVCSLTFALSSVLSAQTDVCCKKIFLYGVLGCVAFVLPTPDTPAGTTEEVVIDGVQKVALTYSMGLLIGGSLMLMMSEPRVDQ